MSNIKNLEDIVSLAEGEDDILAILDKEDIESLKELLNEYKSMKEEKLFKERVVEEFVKIGESYIIPLEDMKYIIKEEE